MSIPYVPIHPIRGPLASRLDIRASRVEALCVVYLRTMIMRFFECGKTHFMLHAKECAAERIMVIEITAVTPTV
jgi:hypothetical protein